MSDPAKPTTLLAVAAAIVGMLVGGLGVYWTGRDRLEKEIRDKVKVEREIAALKERVKSLEGDFWTIKTRGN